MPRTMRVEYPGAIYHVMDRGDRREDIFVNDVDRQDFLKTLAEACQKTGWQVHAYCLSTGFNKTPPPGGAPFGGKGRDGL
jgi:REP element-mobilizing transposase RayT